MPRIDTILIVGAIIVVLVGLMFPTLGTGSDLYFSPQTLEFRRQSHFWPFPDSATRPPVSEYLLSEGFVTLQPAETSRWTIAHSHTPGMFSHGTNLYRAFTRYDDLVIEWCRENPECAKIYWAEVFRLLRSGDRVDRRVAEKLLEYRRWEITDVHEMKKWIRTVNEYERYATCVLSCDPAPGFGI